MELHEPVRFELIVIRRTTLEVRIINRYPRYRASRSLQTAHLRV